MNLRHLRVLAALALFATASCRSIDSSTFDAEFAASSAHVFRGLILNDGIGFETQGKVNLNRGDGSIVSGHVWGFVDLTGDPGDAALESGSDLRYSRIDIGASWAKTYSDWALSAGLLNYNFPNVVTASTSEAFVAAEWIEKWYRPRAILYYDTQNADDLYLRVGVHPRYELDRALFADVGFDLGYMGGGQSEFWYGTNASGVSDALLSGELTYVRDENLRAFLRAGYSSVLLSDLKDQNSINGFDDTNAWLSIGVGFTY